MSHIPVRLFIVGLLAAALVGGLVRACYGRYVGSEALEQSNTPVLQQTVTARTSTLLPVRSECSALDDGVPFVQNLAKLARAVEPMSPERANALAHDVLLRDVNERVPKIDVDTLSPAATVCVVRHVNDDNEVVWRVEFQGNKQAIMQER